MVQDIKKNFEYVIFHAKSLLISNLKTPQTKSHQITKACRVCERTPHAAWAGVSNSGRGLAGRNVLSPQYRRRLRGLSELSQIAIRISLSH